MFVLYRIQNAQATYSSFTHRSEVFEDVRSNYGLTEAEYLEFVSQGVFIREYLYLGVYEGEIPEPESAFSKAARNAQAAQRAKLYSQSSK